MLNKALSMSMSLQLEFICLHILFHAKGRGVRTLLEISWWRHEMEKFSALLAICAGNSPVTGEFLAQRPVTRSFDVFFDLRPNKRLSKQSWGWWFETSSRPLWRHCNVLQIPSIFILYTELLNHPCLYKDRLNAAHGKGWKIHNEGIYYKTSRCLKDALKLLFNLYSIHLVPFILYKTGWNF